MNKEYVKEDGRYIFDKEQDKWSEPYLNQSQTSFIVIAKWGEKKIAKTSKYSYEEIPFGDKWENVALLAMTSLEEYVFGKEDRNG